SFTITRRAHGPTPFPSTTLFRSYGKLPEAAQTLLATHRLRLSAEPLGIVKIDANESQASIHFSAKPNVEPMRIIELIQKRRDVRLFGQDKLKVEIKQGQQVAARIEAVKDVLRALV